MAITVYTHNTPKRYTNSKGSLTRAQKKLRSRTRDSSAYTTAELIYSDDWPIYGGSFRTTNEDYGSTVSKNLIKKATNVVGKSSNTFRTHA